jgi:class 3 adenylate cyclase
LRAALALQDRLDTVRCDVRRSHGLEFRVRIAVNTGPIVVGAIGAGLRADYTATGNTTSVAAQLLRVAEPGQIVLTGRTRALATGHFEFVDLAPTALTEAPGAVAVHALTRRAPAHAGSTSLAGV